MTFEQANLVSVGARVRYHGNIHTIQNIVLDKNIPQRIVLDDGSIVKAVHFNRVEMLPEPDDILTEFDDDNGHYYRHLNCPANVAAWYNPEAIGVIAHPTPYCPWCGNRLTQIRLARSNDPDTLYRFSQTYKTVMFLK